ncbi:hypothetical protein [Helicobacter macacae]|uniref:Type I restriction modification DNA specificity domain-containing protein n=1 Tax=Helicobacter macacae MIT 99-5501 TaxID=1357400 RepID=V8CD40_9HELI|nr:hypothetical protein [Helicobacter macacae]ETD25002.1 hypothetical protein HMPREF2086_00337 [Helicobacter macacae MIT 99-5501]
MNEKHINKSLCESDSTKKPLPCEVESQISPLLREAESKSPLPCGGGLGVGIIPQGYKQTSIGIIPQDWEVVRLGEVCRTTMNQMRKSVIARQWQSHNEAIHKSANIDLQ